MITKTSGLVKTAPQDKSLEMADTLVLKLTNALETANILVLPLNAMHAELAQQDGS